MIRSLDQRGVITIEGLVTKAQEGCEVSRNRLAEQFEGRLSQYVYRLTLNPDLTEDIVQEMKFDCIWEISGNIYFDSVQNQYCNSNDSKK